MKVETKLSLGTKWLSGSREKGQSKVVPQKKYTQCLIASCMKLSRGIYHIR